MTPILRGTPSGKKQQAIEKEMERKRKRMSLPSTIDSSTSVNPEKVGRRRLSRRLSNPIKPLEENEEKKPVAQECRLSLQSADAYNKENNNQQEDDENTVVQGPTPYYKIVEERGGQMSPRLTRSSAKKKKQRICFDKPPLSKKDRLMLFSPPNEERMRQREEEEREEAETSFARQVQAAKDEGPLLVFTPPRRGTHKYAENVDDLDKSSDSNSHDGLTVVNSKRMEQIIASELRNCLQEVVQQQANKNNKNEEEARALVNKLMDEKVALVEERAKLKYALEEIKSQLKSIVSESEAKIEAKARAYERLEGENAEIAYERDKAQKCVEQLTEEFHNRQQRIHDLENEILPESEALLKEADERVRCQQEEIIKAENEASEYRNRIKELQQQLETAMSAKGTEVQALLQSHAKLEEDNSALMNDMEIMTRRLGSLEAELETCLQKLNQVENFIVPKMEKKLRDAENKLQEQREENAELKDQAAQSFAKIELLQRELIQSQSRFETRSREAEAEVQDLSRDCERLEQEKRNLVHALSEREKQEQILISQLKGLKEKLSDLEQNKLPQAESRLSVALEECRQKEIESSKLEFKLALNQERVESLEKELKEKRTSDEKERRGAQLLGDENAATLQRLQAIESENKIVVERMEMEIANRELQIKVLEDQVVELNEALDEQMKELDETGEQKNMLIRSLEELENDRLAATTEAEARIQDSSYEILELKKALEAAKQREEAAKQREDYAIQREETIKAEKELLSLQSQKQFEDLKRMESELRETTRERDKVKACISLSGNRERELSQQLVESDQVRRVLHAKVMQLMGNIRVFVRVRPSSPEEEAQVLGTKNEQPIFKFLSVSDCTNDGESADLTKKSIELTEPWKDRGGLRERRARHRFGFDNVFQQQHDQDAVWDSTKPLIQSAVDGYNVTLFAYGQTGSGKTYTMLGEPGNEGIIQRSITKLFAEKEKLKNLSNGSIQVEIKVELLEIYNENVYDMLSSHRDSERKGLKLCMTMNTVEGNNVVVTSTKSDCMELLAIAQKRRCVKSTSSNAESSRSHLVFTLHYTASEGSKIIRKSKLNICDLAGSERLSKSEAHLIGGALLNETKNINKSLSALSNVIEQLQTGAKAVAYRESKLTSLLCDSLGGNSKTLAIVCCSPLTTHYHESLSSLRFAEKASNVELKATSTFTC